MATTLSSPPLPLPGLRDCQATLNVDKILDTINNLVRILELALMVNLVPSPPPPTPPATVILPKATTLGSGLDQVSPQSAPELHSQVLTDRIQSITKWAKAVAPTSPLTCSDGPSPLAPSHSSPATTPTLTRDAQHCKAKAVCRKAQRQCRKAAVPPASPAPPVGPAFFSAGPASLGITHPIPPIGPTDSCTAPACLGLTCQELLFYPALTAQLSSAWSARRPTSFTPTPASRPPSTTPSTPSISAPQPTIVRTSLFTTFGSNGVPYSPNTEAHPDWEHEGNDDDPWSESDPSSDPSSGLPPYHPVNCTCGLLFGHHRFHSHSGKLTCKCDPIIDAPPPSPIPYHDRDRLGLSNEFWDDIDDLECPTIHPDPLSHFWPGPLHLSKKAIKALTAQARTLACEDADEIAAITGTPGHYIEPPNPLIVTNSDSMGNHYTKPLPRFSSMRNLLRWLRDEGYRPDMDVY
jgi:hypothetical protein